MTAKTLYLEKPDQSTYTLSLSDPEVFSLQFALGGQKTCLGTSISMVYGDKTILDIKWNESQQLTASYYTDGNKTPFVLTGPEQKWDAIYSITCNGVNFELFVGGILFDEEWVLGNPSNNGELHLRILNHEQVKSLSVFDGYLRNGGKDLLDEDELEKEEELLGKSMDGMQYFMPVGPNAFAGDCMPFFHNGIYHLYYLYDRRHHGSKCGFGAHQWAHASTKDLIHWEHHPIALGITDQTEGSICTGSVIERDGKYYAFYSKRDTMDRCEKVTYAVGDSPDSFEKTNRVVFDFPSPPYIKGPGRDPFVFFSKEDRQYHMLLTTRVEDPVNGNKGGSLARLTSHDLTNWTLAEPYLPAYNDDPECSDYFKFNDWYYLIFSNEGIAKYRMSKQPFGPWEKPPVDLLDAPCYRVMKTAEFTGNRRISAAFLEKEFGHFGGNIVFREIIQRTDGTLGTKHVPEMTLEQGAILTPEFADSQNGQVILDAVYNFQSVKAVTKLPRNYRLSFTICAEEGSGYMGVCFRSGGDMSTGYDLLFNVTNQTVEVKKATDGYWKDNNKQKITAVDCLSGELHCSLVVYEDIADLCINDERTLCARIEVGESFHDLILYSHFMKTSFQDILITPLSNCN